MQEEILDKELYQKYLEGDQSAFEKLVKKHKDHMIYFIARYTKDAEIAEDISQDVFVYLLLHKEQYDFKYSFKTYLYMIAKCRAMNYLKREKKALRNIDYQDVYVEDNKLEEIVYQNDREKQLRNVLHQLKPDYQAVICLAALEGFKYKEVAKIMDKNVNTVKVLLNRAKKKLRKLLEEEGFSYEV